MTAIFSHLMCGCPNSAFVGAVLCGVGGLLVSLSVGRSVAKSFASMAGNWAALSVPWATIVAMNNWGCLIFNCCAKA